jgi:hypothetical protein
MAMSMAAASPPNRKGRPEEAIGASWTITIIVSLLLLAPSGLGTQIIEAIRANVFRWSALLPLLVPFLVGLALRLYGSAVTLTVRGQKVSGQTLRAERGEQGEPEPPLPPRFDKFLALLIFIAFIIVLIVSPATIHVSNRQAGHILVATIVVVFLGLLFGFPYNKTVIEAGKIKFTGIQVASASWCAVYTILEVTSLGG